MPSDERARAPPPDGSRCPAPSAFPGDNRPLLKGRSLIPKPAPGTGAADDGRPDTIDQKRYAYPISSSYCRISISISCPWYMMLSPDTRLRGAYIAAKLTS